MATPTRFDDMGRYFIPPADEFMQAQSARMSHRREAKGLNADMGVVRGLITTVPQRIRFTVITSKPMAPAFRPDANTPPAH